MKNLTAIVALFVCLFTPTVFAQSVEEASLSERGNFLVGSTWSKARNGTTSIRKAVTATWPLCGRLTFSAAWFSSLTFRRLPRLDHKPNFVPKSADFQVTVSADGQHFRAVVGDTCMSVSADDSGNGVGMLKCILRDIPASPEGLIVTP